MRSFDENGILTISELIVIIGPVWVVLVYHNNNNVPYLSPSIVFNQTILSYTC